MLPKEASTREGWHGASQGSPSLSPRPLDPHALNRRCLLPPQLPLQWPAAQPPTATPVHNTTQDKKRACRSPHSAEKPGEPKSDPSSRSRPVAEADPPCAQPSSQRFQPLSAPSSRAWSPDHPVADSSPGGPPWPPSESAPPSTHPSRALSAQEPELNKMCSQCNAYTRF